MSMVLGIDPGVNGAAALLTVPARRGGAHPTVELYRVAGLDADGLLALARRAALVVVEAQHAAPRQGAVSAFTLGRGYGWLRGVLETAAGVKAVEVQPAKWRGAYGLEGKRSGIAMARELTGRAVMTHDQADAILLAWWGWRNVVLYGSSG
jgi:hypothetical protein